MWQAKKHVPDCALPYAVADSIQRGILSFKYKGIPTYKCPFDLALYTDVFSDLKPGTILEFGSNQGGSALWMADTLDALGLSETKLFTFDIESSCGYKDQRVNFKICDVNKIEFYLPADFMAALRRPLLFIEDSSHQFRHVKNVLEFFHKHSTRGDYIIVEDGIISVLKAEAQYDGGPFQAIHAFLDQHPSEYQIDRKRCDFFGRNVTWNVDGYIRRIA